MTEADLADVLLALPDTPSSRLLGNLEQFRDAARLYDRSDVQEFLDVMQNRFSARLRA